MPRESLSLIPIYTRWNVQAQSFRASYIMHTVQLGGVRHGGWPVHVSCIQYNGNEGHPGFGIYTHTQKVGEPVSIRDVAFQRYWKDYAEFSS